MPSLDETAHKRDLIKMKTFCSSKDNVSAVRNHGTDWGENTRKASDKGLLELNNEEKKKNPI